MSLPLSERVRLQVRIALSRGLMVLPVSAMVATRDRYTRSSGARRKALGRLVGVLRHRPLEPLTDFALPDNPEIRLAVVRSRLAQLLFWYGERGYEGAETACWQRLCGQATRILEVGANIGYYTVQGAHAAPETPYTAVEANPDTAAIVARNIELNGLKNVSLVHAAVVGDDAPATMELRLPDVEKAVVPTGAYLSEGGEGIKDRPASRTVVVDTVPMSTLIDGVDLLKLDIEGYEANVLESVWPQLLANRPVILVEVLKDVPRLRQVIRDLHAEKYEVRAVGEHGLHPVTSAEIDSPEPLPRYGSRDVVLIPAERADTLG